MKRYIYVDNSNVFIEGQRYSAVIKDMAFNIHDAIERKIFDFNWNIDYGKLHTFLCRGINDIACVKLWGSPPPGDSFWAMVKEKGFEVTTYDKDYGKEKKVDTAITHCITKDAYTIIDKLNSEIILVAGDKDYVPMVEGLKNDGFFITIAFWNHAAKELQKVAATFIDLNPQIKKIKK
jgi:hypothetical protein